MKMQTLFARFLTMYRVRARKDELPRWTVDVILRLRDQRVFGFSEKRNLNHSGDPGRLTIVWLPLHAFQARAVRRCDSGSPGRIQRASFDQTISCNEKDKFYP